jgi:hypothetical protein
MFPTWRRFCGACARTQRKAGATAQGEKTSQVARIEARRPAVVVVEIQQ